MRSKTSVGRDFQDQLLSKLMETKQITTIYLRNRMSLRGRVLRYDSYVVLLDPLDGTPPQLVYKSSMVSISGPRRMPGPGENGDRPSNFRPQGPRPGPGPRPTGAGPRPYGDEPTPRRSFRPLEPEGAPAPEDGRD